MLTPSPSRRLFLLSLPLLLSLGLPLVIGGLAMARAVLLPPVPHTRLMGFDGLQVHGGCLDGTNGPHHGRVWQCKWDVHFDSRFEVLQRDPAAIAWCTTLVRDGFDHNLRAARLGGLTLGIFPPVWGGWTGCSNLIPLAVGFYFDLSIYH